MPDFSKMRLGKKAPYFHPFTPRFASLIHNMSSAVPLPPPPDAIDYTIRVDATPGGWPMMKNDEIGDCAIATIGHLIQLYTSWTKPTPTIISDEGIVTIYSYVSGYQPDNPNTDQGCIIADVLHFWANTGININGYLDKIAGYAKLKVDTAHYNELKYAMWWFGGVYIGVNLPKVWQSTETTWAMPADLSGDNAPGTWGGHAIPVVAYDPDGITVVTWGQEVKMDWRAYATYCDEAWAVISPDFVNQQGVTPANFDWPYLLAAMQHIRESF
jgi:hypothetical protein